MVQARVIPCLLYQKKGLVKTTKFKDPKYIGDPINSLKLFNDKEVDELIFLDIEASKLNRPPDYKIIEEIASECFMPLCYGGGIKTLEMVEKILALGVEKVAINYNNFSNLALIEQAATLFGSQSIVGCIDVKYSFFKKPRVYNHVDKKTSAKHPKVFAKELENAGAGELFINAVNRDGVMKGYDMPLLKEINQSVNVPVIGCGGAGSADDIKRTFDETKVSALAAGSLFVYVGKLKGILINYPSPDTIKEIIS